MTNPSDVREPVSPTTVTHNAEVGPQAEEELACECENAPDATPTTTDESKDLEEGVFAEDDEDKVEPDDECQPCDDNVQPIRTGPSPVKPSADEYDHLKSTAGSIKSRPKYASSYPHEMHVSNRGATASPPTFT